LPDCATTPTTCDLATFGRSAVIEQTICLVAAGLRDHPHDLYLATFGRSAVIEQTIGFVVCG
jgi:hypothetical protein